MDKLIRTPDPSNIWQTVRAMLASALQLLRGDLPERYLFGALKRLRQAENKVRGQLAMMALSMELTSSAPPRDAKPRETPEQKKRAKTRSFAVLPHGLYNYDYSYTPDTPFDEPTSIEPRLAAFNARVDLLEAVMASPERHVKRLARMLLARDAIGASFRFLGVGIALPIDMVRKFLGPVEDAPAIDDSS